jgi:CheY-like chemotaxis protein
MESPRVLLADDLPGMLETVTLLLRDDFEIVGYAEDGEDAIKAATTYNPQRCRFVTGFNWLRILEAPAAEPR